MEQHHYVEARNLSGARVLCVGAPSAFGQDLVEALSSGKARISFCKNIAVAIEMILGGTVELVFLSSSAVGAGDEQDVSRLAQACFGARRVPVIFLGTGLDKNARVRMYRAGILDYTEMPCLPDAVMARAASRLRRADARENQVSEDRLPLQPESIGHAIVQSAMDYARTFQSELVTSKQVAGALGITKRRLNLAFQSVHQTTSGDFLIAQRFSSARRLLSDPTLPIGEIAHMLGYHDASNFSNAFFKRFGHSPSTYRKLARR